ncbi:MAG: glycosyltransferase [Planctomycetota bacterium]
MAISYSIVIPAFNEAQTLPDTLANLRAAMSAVEPEHGVGEIVVVDNNSSDDTAEFATQHGADRVVFEPVNQIGRARNAGAAQADPSSSYLLFVDADTRVSAELLVEALRRLEQGDAGGGARVTFDEAVGWLPGLFCFVWNWVSRSRNLAAGCFLFCRRDAFEAVGGFDLRYLIKEELYLSSALKKWGVERDQRFEVFQDPPVVTSNRKLDRFAREVPRVLMAGFLPWASRSRWFCRYWYGLRGEAKSASAQAP